MPKQIRKTFRPFASNADLDQVSQIGSLRAGAPTFSKDPEILQNLSNYIDGWFSIAIGENSPAIEDMNAIQFVFAYMIYQILEDGVAAWDDGTTYYIGSMVSFGSKLYVSTANDNLGNAVSDGTKWKILSGLDPVTVTGEDTFDVLPTHDYLRVDPTGATASTTTVTLPPLASVALGYKVTIKNVSPNLSATRVKIVPDNPGTENMDEMVEIDLDAGPPMKPSVTLVKGSATTWDVI